MKQSYIKNIFVLITLLFQYNICKAEEGKTIFVYSNRNKIIKGSNYIYVSSLDSAINYINNNYYNTSTTILMSEGEHHLNKTIKLVDCKKSITIKGQPNGKTIITSNKRINNDSITVYSHDIICFPVSSNIFSLKVNNRSIPIASSTTQKEPYKMKQFSKIKLENIKNTYSSLFPQEEINKMEIGAYIYIYCKWIQYKLKIEKIDKTTGKVIMGGMKINVDYINNNSNVYYTINNSRLIMKPSTFCSLNNMVYYRMNRNEKINQIQISYPVLNNYILITDCNTNITIENIHFTDANITKLIIAEVQGKANLPSTIEIEKSSNVIISNCEFSQNLGYSIQVANNSSNCTINDNYFHDLGGGGIIVGNYKIPDKTHNISINNNLIKSYGLINASCIGIFVTKANNITITNNTICNGYYTGISLGWTWGFAKSYSYNNYVANNHIHHLMQCVLSDGAGIYTLGKQDGTIIENNYIHDIISRAFSSAGSSLLYFDEGTSNAIARNNICFGAHSGFHEHYGKCNIVENNVFAYTNLAAIRLSNMQKDSLLTIKNNILILDCGTAYNRNLTRKAIFKNNRTYDGIVINKKNGLTKFNNPININMNINNLYQNKIINKKFSYGVTSNYLKSQSHLSINYLNNYNKMVHEHFSPCSSFFKIKYK